MCLPHLYVAHVERNFSLYSPSIITILTSYTPLFYLYAVSKQRFIDILKDLQSSPETHHKQNLLFRFENTQEAAYHNAIVLEQFNFNVSEAILAQSHSQVMFGSEFKHPNQLQELLQDHPRWEKFKNILLFGATFPLTPISHQDRLRDLDFHAKRGNHQSAIKNKQVLDKLINDDIVKGYALPLPLQLYKYIPNASIAPLGCQEQETINEQGIHIPKFRLTHDQSFPGPSGLSVNLRVEKEKLPPCMYSFVLSRILHYIVDLRKRHPTRKIFLCKFDLDSAYRRCHLSGTTATECLTIYDEKLIMALRLTFGGSPCPPMWGYISDTIIDIGNSLIQNEFWDHEEFFDPISNQLQVENCLPISIPFHQAKDLAV